MDNYFYQCKSCLFRVLVNTRFGHHEAVLLVTPVLFLECLLWFNCIIIPVEKDDEIEKYRGTNRKLTRMELEQISNNLE